MLCDLSVSSSILTLKEIEAEKQQHKLKSNKQIFQRILHTGYKVVIVLQFAKPFHSSFVQTWQKKLTILTSCKNFLQQFMHK